MKHKSSFEHKKKKLVPQIPVVILNGFLGSGKTTLFRNLLSQSQKKKLSLCVVVNDMSELDVDGELIANSSMVEENSLIFQSIHGCVLSSEKGLKKLEASLNKLLSHQQPDLVLIETSGSCHPMPLITFFRNHPQLQLTGVLALVDSLMLAQDYLYGERILPLMQQQLARQQRGIVNLLVEQIMFCSHLILTKTDRLSQEKIPQMARHIQQINPLVDMLAVRMGKLPIEEVLAMPAYNFHRVTRLIEELRPELARQADGDQPYNIGTRIIKDERPFHPERLWEVCNHYLGKMIYRSKGFFWLASRDDVSLLWNQAAGNISLELVGYWRASIVTDKNNNLLQEELEQVKTILAQQGGRFGDRKCHLTVIGDHSQLDAFTEALKSCFLSEAEIKQWESGADFADPWPKNIVRVKI